MISFDGIVRISLHDMTRGGQQLIEHPRIGRRAIGAHLRGAGAMIEGTGKESASSCQIPLLGDQYVDDLAILVDRSVQVDPAPGDLHVRFVGEPPITGNMSAGSGRVDQQRSEPLHLPIHAHVVDSDAALG